MTTLELIEYYVNLLILQYTGKPKAEATIRASATGLVLPQISEQELVFSAVPTSGSFVVSWNGNSSAAINWDDSLSTVQSKLQAVSGLSDIVVTGSIPSLTLSASFVGVDPVAPLFVLVSNSLSDGDPVEVTIDETDLTLPLAVQNAFNLSGSDLAVGAQLDIIGKYVGVSRVGVGLSGQITLDDSDYRSLIQMGIIRNSASSSLAAIQQFLHMFFPGQMLVIDYQNMHLSYLVSTTVGSNDLIQLVITENLLPKPMGVGISAIIYAPVIDRFFGFCTYEVPEPTSNTGFNTYEDYTTDTPWVDYSDAILL